MKKTQKFLFFILAIFFNTASFAQANSEKLNLPGDNLNLYAVLKLFQESPTLETFERSLNDSSQHINNLDLNGDDKIDYIKVSDKVDGDIHNISLKISVNKTEDQDVAVFVVQKLADNKVQVQLIGDEDLYGKNYIIEPNMETTVAAGETPNPGYTPHKILANGETVVVEQTSTAQIANWPVVQYIYVPTYISWSSPWYWDYYPTYWRTWRPVYWHYYYGYYYNWEYDFYGHYRRCNYYRVPGWRDRYYGGNYRSRSHFVENRYHQGGYRQTYSRPQLAREGVMSFRRDNPTAPTVNNRLPKFDRTGTPIRVKPEVTTPGRNPVIRPVVRDMPDTKLPGTRPTKSGIVLPDNDHSIQPAPIRPTKPVIRPKSSPVDVMPHPTKPVRPSFTPSDQNPRPSIRPVPYRSPVTQPTRTPASQPVREARPVKNSREN